MTLVSTATISDLTFIIRGNINDNNGKRRYQYDMPSSTESAVLLPGFGDTLIRERDVILVTYTADNKDSFIRLKDPTLRTTHSTMYLSSQLDCKDKPTRLSSRSIPKNLLSHSTSTSPVYYINTSNNTSGQQLDMNATHDQAHLEILTLIHQRRVLRQHTRLTSSRRTSRLTTTLSYAKVESECLHWYRNNQDDLLALINKVSPMLYTPQTALNQSMLVDLRSCPGKAADEDSISATV
ncbi:hypothetical protein BKA57DRAFT_506540 [Linnemannia elongata]|nr:hypothetical protein BKA57DRAFT_506540 [Linnemannia elongata]